MLNAFDKRFLQAIDGTAAGYTAPVPVAADPGNSPGDDVGIYVMPYGATIAASATVPRRVRLDTLGVGWAHGEIVATTVAP